jgi:hypothetical protein
MTQVRQCTKAHWGYVLTADGPTDLDAHYARLEAQASSTPLAAAPNDSDDEFENAPAPTRADSTARTADGQESDGEMEETSRAQGGENVMVLGKLEFG